MSNRIVVVGAGGLSLGFFGPELCNDYRLTFLDVAVKEDLIRSIHARHEYTANIAGDEIEHVAVTGVNAFRLDDPAQDDAIRRDIADARVFFTAVGIRNLDKALSYLSERLKGRSDSIYILCAENGEDVAAAWRTRLPDNIHLCETVMGRMCRIEDHAAPSYAPVAPGFEWAVVGEALYDMPLEDRYDDPEVFHSTAFLFCPSAEFQARDRVKLYAHNGLHFFIAAHGRLRGVEQFSDMADDPEMRQAARELLDGEIAPALWRECGAAMGRQAFDAYMERLPDRLFSKTLADHIARGIRNIEAKFDPNERVMGGLRLLLRNGIEPKRYCSLIAAGLEVARRDESPELAERLFGAIPDEDVKTEVKARWKTIRRL